MYVHYTDLYACITELYSVNLLGSINSVTNYEVRILSDIATFLLVELERFRSRAC
jgi:hypothetical protein